MNKKAFQLAISTIVVLILGLLVLAGLIYSLNGGLDSFKSSTQPFLDTTQSTSIKQACSLSCDNKDKLTYCCREYNIDKSKIKCLDERLELSCDLDCKDFKCEK